MWKQSPDTHIRSLVKVWEGGLESKGCIGCVQAVDSTALLGLSGSQSLLGGCGQDS